MDSSASPTHLDFPAVTRRTFLQQTGLGGAVGLLQGGAAFPAGDTGPQPEIPMQPPVPALDLAPAEWIWYPSSRCLPNTFVLFRRTLEIPGPVVRATGWIAADSRYRLEVNGRRVQWGPAPSDPRWMEADPVDLTAALHPGTNVLGVTVLYYGHGDGTWATGKPGLLVKLDIVYGDGRTGQVVSDGSWQARLARSWKPGQYRRWYLRALQEEFDARAYPYGWTGAGHVPDADWLPAMPMPDVTARVPALCSSYPDYANDSRGDGNTCALRPRTIPLPVEEIVAARPLSLARSIRWLRPPQEFFECLTPGSYTAAPLTVAVSGGMAGVELTEETSGAALTYEMAEELVGWPRFRIECPAGTTVELMVEEYHDPQGPALMNNHFHSWTRFICREGVNDLETFDYEACKWLQLHVHGVRGAIRISEVGVRRRKFPWPQTPAVETSDDAVNRLVAASINTLVNSAQETAVDGMGRERQQYSGDGGHQLLAIYYAFGETRLPARFIRTFSQGLTDEGFFLDCWPAYDRLARLWERQMQLSSWGPLLDHGVGFVFDCYHHYLYTGQREPLAEALPRLLRFVRYLRSLQGEDDLLPVENLGVPSVYIDHLAYTRQRHKQCAFNLYAAAMLGHALAPLCALFGLKEWEDEVQVMGEKLLHGAVRKFWDGREGAFVANLPWRAEEGQVRYCDRSLALGILFDLCPEGRTSRAVQLLVETPESVGMSYPANACWRLWALGRAGRGDLILRDFRTRWSSMVSVRENNSLQEFWQAAPDSGVVMSHCAVAPLYVLFQELAGIRPAAPGFSRCVIRPQPADLELLDVTAFTVRGALRVRCEGPRGRRVLTLTVPPGCEADLQTDHRERIDLPRNAEGIFRLPAGRETVIHPQFL